MYSCKTNIFQLNYTIWKHKKRYLYTHIYKFWKITLNWHKHIWRSAINTLRNNMRKIRSIDFVSKFDISNDKTWVRSLYLEIRKMLIKLCYFLIRSQRSRLWGNIKLKVKKKVLYIVNCFCESKIYNISCAIERFLGNLSLIIKIRTSAVMKIILVLNIFILNVFKNFPIFIFNAKITIKIKLT